MKNKCARRCRSESPPKPKRSADEFPPSETVPLKRRMRDPALVAAQLPDLQPRGGPGWSGAQPRGEPWTHAGGFEFPATPVDVRLAARCMGVEGWLLDKVPRMEGNRSGDRVNQNWWRFQRPGSLPGTLGSHGTCITSAINILRSGQAVPGHRQDASGTKDPQVFAAKEFAYALGYTGPSYVPESPSPWLNSVEVIVEMSAQRFGRSNNQHYVVAPVMYPQAVWVREWEFNEQFERTSKQTYVEAGQFNWDKGQKVRAEETYRVLETFGVGPSHLHAVLDPAPEKVLPSEKAKIVAGGGGVGSGSGNAPPMADVQAKSCRGEGTTGT